MHNMTIHFAYTTIFTKCNHLLFMKLHFPKIYILYIVYINLFFSHMCGISWLECCCSPESIYATTSNNLQIPSIPDWTNGYNYNSQHPWSDWGLSAGPSIFTECCIYKLLSFVHFICFLYYSCCKVSNYRVFKYKVRNWVLRGDRAPQGALD